MAVRLLIDFGDVAPIGRRTTLRKPGTTSFMPPETMRVETDVLVIGSGAAGMYAAIEAARAGCRVLLVDRSLIGRGGATVMAQMTVAAALGFMLDIDS